MGALLFGMLGLVLIIALEKRSLISVLSSLKEDERENE